MAATVLPFKRRDHMHTDFGNAERLVAAHGDGIAWVHEWGAWAVWDGRRWARDDSGAVVRLAKNVVRQMYRDAADLPDKDRQALASWAAKSESSGRLDALLKLARAELRLDHSPVTRSLADFDADPWALNVANGILDLQTGTLRPHERGALCRKLLDVPWEPAATCPRWRAFLERVLGDDAALVAFVQRAVGYTLTGRTDEQCLFFLHGRGANGKSTFLETLRRLFGEYGAQAEFSTFAERRSGGDGPRNDVARLERARLVVSSELGEGKRFNEELVKSLTGSETVTARFLHREHFEFRPEFALWLAANHKPVIRGTDDGIWRRVRLIPFEVQIPEGERDAGLGDALLEELPGILAWAVAGCQYWRQWRLEPPTAVSDATQAYRDESDVIGAWLADQCVLTPDAETHAAALYANYKRWAETNGEHLLSNTAFGKRLTERGIDVEKRGGLKYRQGVRLSAEALLSP